VACQHVDDGEDAEDAIESVFAVGVGAEAGLQLHLQRWVRGCAEAGHGGSEGDSEGGAVGLAALAAGEA
jgi:hypothetical protein